MKDLPLTDDRPDGEQLAESVWCALADLTPAQRMSFFDALWGILAVRSYPDKKRPCENDE